MTPIIDRRTSGNARTCPAHGTEYVRWVQSALNQVRALRLPLNGAMDAPTRSALRSFQRTRGLPPDGIAGPDTEQALRAELSAAEAETQEAEAEPEFGLDEGEAFAFETLDLESPASLPTLRRGSSGAAVSDLQRRLNAAGFSSGTVDGIFGSLTEAAVRSFQSARRLSVDGIAGPNTWGALLGAAPPSGPGVPAPQPSASGKLSGAHWVAQFPGSKSIDSLVEPFRSNVARFLAALKRAGARSDINATRRPPERAYLMHYAWSIVKDGLSPTLVPPYPGVDIQWVHIDSTGRVNQAASRDAAEEMVRSYGLVDRPALTSLHIEGRAIDWTIAWDGALTIPDGRSGAPRTIRSEPRNGGGNRELWALGASYGVIKLVKDPPDPPHWSDNGH